MQSSSRSESPELSAFLSRVRTGKPSRIGDVTLVPLLADDEPIEAEMLGEALESGHTTVTEVSEGGAVNFVTVSHSGVVPLLLLDGEQVVGAKQNRIFNASFVIEPGKPVAVPVSCVERGRWGYNSREFGSSETTVNSDARRAKLTRVSQSASVGRGYDADQGAVWRDVDTYMDKTKTQSVTGAFSDAYRGRATSIEHDLAKVEVEPRQVGFAAVRGEVVLGMDVFGTTALFAKGWKKAIRGVLAEVHDVPAPDGDPVTVVRRALSDVAEISAVHQVAPGGGHTLHGTGKGLVLGAVVGRGHVYHAVVASSV
jgi:hypothetical protein